MKNKICFLIILIILSLSTTTFATTIYTDTDNQTIAKGVVLNKTTMFTDIGWIYLNVIEINAKSSNISLTPLISQNGISNFSTIKSMCSDLNIIVALNGDYFARRPNTTNRGQSIGLLGSEGNILSSAADENIDKETMGSFILEKNNIIYSYLKNTVTISSENDEKQYISSGINKYVPYNSIGIFTNKWNTTSIGNSEGAEIVEAIVIDNKITEIREYLEPVTIPENGYVLTALGPDAITYILDNFKVGDTIKYTIDINLDTEKMKFAISGGTMLVQNGEVPKFSHIIWGNNEMSAIGSNKDNSKIYLISCTRNNNGSTGISQKKFAELIKDYGIHNALCLDGGGSTTMMAKELGNKTLSTTLSRYTNYQRPVANGIGIINNTKPTNRLSGLILEINDKYIFKNNSTGFSIKGYDTNYYPMEIDINNIKVTFNNKNAKYENGKIIGLTEGDTIVKVTYNNKTTTQNLKILGEVYKLEITPTLSNITQNETQKFQIIGIDKNGYKTKIDNSLLTWNIEQGSGKITNGIYTPTINEQIIISGSIDEAKVYSLINVNKEQTKILDKFEKVNGEFSSYPNTLNGSIETTSKIKKNDRKSLKITYDFTDNTQAIRGAYYDYNDSIKIPILTTEIGIWVYSPVKNENSIKSQYKDEHGNTYICILANQIDWTGWKFLSYNKVEKIKEIVSIYVAQSNTDITNSSYICLDDLIVTYYGLEGEQLELPNNIIKKDINNYKMEDGYHLSVIDSIYKPIIMFDKLLNSRIVSNINNSDSIITYTNMYEEYSNINNNITNANRITIMDETDFKVIYLNINKKGISQTDFNQWITLIDNLNDKKHIIIVLSDTLDYFSDLEEQKLFLNVLRDYQISTKKQCWIIQPNDITDVQNINDLKLITIGNKKSYDNILDIYNTYKYIDIYISPNSMSYELNNIF